MYRNYIKNIEHEAILSLAKQVQIQSGHVVSKTLAQNEGVSIALFAFDKYEEMGAHKSHGDAMVTVLEGTGIFTVGGNEYTVAAGQTLIMPANVSHSGYAKESLKMLLVVVFQ